MSKVQKLNKLVIVAALLTGSGLWSGCEGSDPSEGPQDDIAPSTRNHLTWKRQHVVEQDLTRALDLTPEELCTELGYLPCIDEVHLVVLGGNDPIDRGMYEPLTEPTVTTPLALDRVVLSACGARVQADQNGEPRVFRDLDFSSPAPAADSDAFRATVTTLYQRLLARDPIEAEFEALAELSAATDDDVLDAADFAHAVCFAVGTTTEFLFH